MNGNKRSGSQKGGGANGGYRSGKFKDLSAQSINASSSSSSSSSSLSSTTSSLSSSSVSMLSGAGAGLTPAENLNEADLIRVYRLYRQCEIDKLLPKFASILNNTPDVGINMNDLDDLQLDLEKYLNSSELRSRYIQSQIDLLDGIDGETGGRSGGSSKKSKGQGTAKRKRTTINSTSTFLPITPLSLVGATTTTTTTTNTTTGTTTTTTTPYQQQQKLSQLSTTITDDGNQSMYLNKRHSLPVMSQLGDSPKLNLPKSDTSDKFWLSVEPFCANINNSHALFLDKLIEECSQDIDLKIPDLGNYYVNEWNDSANNLEQELSEAPQQQQQHQQQGKIGDGIDTTATPNDSDIKKNALNAIVDTLSNPLSQRLLAGLIEERVINTIPTVTTKLKASDLNILKNATITTTTTTSSSSTTTTTTTNGPTPRSALCMDRHLEKVLIEQGLITIDDIPKTINGNGDDNDDDEILQEIKKCQQELITINKFNQNELIKLKKIVKTDLKKQDIKLQLDFIDNEILLTYKKILLIKQEQIDNTKENENFDKKLFEKSLKEFELQVNQLLLQQNKLQKNLDEFQLIDD